MTFLLITILLTLPYTVLIMYYRQGWVSMKNYVVSKALSEIDLPFVSIIIAARNEEINIRNCIQSIISQTYPQNKFELIVVDDHSTDNTAFIVNSYKKENIRLIKLEDFTKNIVLNSYKKKSIETALGFAQGDLIITTDADCIVPLKWLETIVTFYKEKNPVFIAAPVSFFNSFSKKTSLNLLRIFESLDFMALQGITGASVHKKFHSMCNGANLAYEKKVFYEVNGFEGIDNIASGDDMLLMHKIEKVYPDRILFLKSTEVIVQTRAATTLKGFINQRIRWASKADKYDDKKITIVLLLVYLLNVWFFILGICSFLYVKAIYLFLISIIIKILVELLFLFPVAKFFNKQKSLWWFAPAQPFHIIYTIIAGWLGKSGRYQWKRRKVY